MQDAITSPSVTPSNSRKQSKSWCFTINNPNGFRPAFNAETTRTLVYQLECGDNGTQHLQGYIEYKSKRTLAGAKRLLGNDGAHLEARKGTRSQAIEYARKVDTRVEGPWEFGDMELDTQGKRRDLVNFREQVMDSAMTYEEILLE